MLKRSIESSPRLLIVEGYSDLLFYAEFLEYLGHYGDDVYIKQIDGGGNLNAELRVILRPDRLLRDRKTKIGILVDADISPAGAQVTAAVAKSESIKAALQSATGREIQHGHWNQKPGECDLGFFVVPDGQKDGEIESLVWQAWSNVSANAAKRRCIEDYVACMSAAGIRPQSRDKGLVNSFTAIANDEDPRLGPSARAKVFEFDLPEFDPLKQFLLNF